MAIHYLIKKKRSFLTQQLMIFHQLKDSKSLGIGIGIIRPSRNQVPTLCSMIETDSSGDEDGNKQTQ